MFGDGHLAIATVRVKRCWYAPASINTDSRAHPFFPGAGVRFHDGSLIAPIRVTRMIFSPTLMSCSSRGGVVSYDFALAAPAEAAHSAW